MFFELYFEALSKYPVTTLVISLFIIALLIHLVTPIICGVYNFFLRFWTRGKLGNENWYMGLCEAYPSEPIIEHQGLDYYWDGEAWTDTTDSNLCLYLDKYDFLYARKKCHKAGGTPLSKLDGDCVAKRPDSNYYWLLLGAGLMSMFGAAIVTTILDYLITYHLFGLMIVLFAALTVAAFLFGGRFVFDIDEKVKKLEESKK